MLNESKEVWKGFAALVSGLGQPYAAGGLLVAGRRKKTPAMRILSHCGLGLAAPTAPDLLLLAHFQVLSSLI
jgi:hypothetical protein